MNYYMDNGRHLVCLPYSLENLHLMAKELGIKKHWFHDGKYPHYDIPKRMIENLKLDSRITVVSSRKILEIIRAKNIS